MRPVALGYAVLAVTAAVMAAGFAPTPPAPALGGALSATEMAAGLRRLTFSMNPTLLQGVHLEAVETWTPADAGERAGVERDAVTFYRSVPIEVQQNENDRPLDAGAVRNQKKLALQLEGLIDKAVAGGDGQEGHAGHAGGGEAGRLLNLGGAVWTLDKFQAHFVWDGERGPLLDGRPTLLLRFTPAVGEHPQSRLARLLSRTSGVIKADAQTGQILGGSFHSLGSVKFGAGLLADISSFDGSFTLQPVTTAQGVCWVMRQAEVRMRSRELFHRSNGTESMTYTVVSAPVHEALSTP